MANCCSKCTKNPPPTIISVSGQEDLVDDCYCLVKLKGKIGFEKESRYLPEERGSLESIPSIPLDNTPLPMRR